MNNAAYKDYALAVDKIKFEYIETVTVYKFTKQFVKGISYQTASKIATFDVGLNI